MKSFLGYVTENVLPTAQVVDGGLDIEKPAVRAAINAALAGVTSQAAVTPYVVYNHVSKLLAQYHIILPRKFLEGDKGVKVFEVRQFGLKMGMTDSGEFISQVPATHYLFLQYGIISPFGVTYAKPTVGGMYRVTARLVDKVELDRLLDMAEITMSEEAECRQNAAKAMAPKEPMHDVDDAKRPGAKSAVETSQRKSNKKLSAGELEEGLMDRINPFAGAAKALGTGGAAAEPKPDMRIMTPAKPVEKKPPKEGSPESSFPSMNEGRMPASVIKHKQKLANMTPEEKAKKFAGKSEEQLKSMARRHGYGKDSTEYSKHVKEEQIDELKKPTPETALRVVNRAEGSDEWSPKAANRLYARYKKRYEQPKEKKTEVKEDIINEISHKLALKAMKKSEKRGSQEYERDMTYDRLSDPDTHYDRASRLRKHMTRKFGHNKPGRGNAGGDRLAAGPEGRNMSDRLTHGKRAGLPSRRHVTDLKTNIKVSLGKHKKPNLPEETQIDELYGKGSIRKIMGHHEKESDRAYDKLDKSRGHTKRNAYEKKAEYHSYQSARAMDLMNKKKKMKEETQFDETYTKPSSGRKTYTKPGHNLLSHEDHEKASKAIANMPKPKSRKETPEEKMARKRLEEKLTKGMSAADVIHDFVHSDDPKFKGKSVKERQKMALGAYYGMHPEKSKKNLEEGIVGIKRSSRGRIFKQDINTLVKKGLHKRGEGKTILVTRKNDPRAAKGGGVIRIPKEKWDPSKYNMASE